MTWTKLFSSWNSNQSECRFCRLRLFNIIFVIEMDKTKPCHVVLRKFPTTNLKSTEFESRSKTFFQTSKITKECVIILEKCPITNLKTAQILLDKCPVKDLKIPVVKLKKVTLPSANHGGEKTLPVWFSQKCLNSLSKFT